MSQQYGLLFDNYWCTGCHSCEISCKNEHDLPLGQWGIKLMVLGPWELTEKGKWEHKYFPVLSSLCDLCKDRTENGDIPACQLHCLASAIEYGPIEELAKMMAERGRSSSILIP